MYKTVDISIIIPLYKGGKYCNNLLQMIQQNSLYKQMYKTCKIEVVFVNDFPDEKIRIEDKDRNFDVKIIEQERNMGIHASRVDGIENSNGTYIIMFDQDDQVSDNWLYSQWNKIITENAEACVCNGWKGRFRSLWKTDRTKDINSLSYYLSVRNAIFSPGQVIIKKECIPDGWKHNIQKCNGADDFFLWILILKKGVKFTINNEQLFYHSPERNEDSINAKAMIESLIELLGILRSKELLEENECTLLDDQIERLKYLKCGEKSKKSRAQEEKHIKYNRMFFILLNWLNLKNQGVEIEDYFIKRDYRNIAIYGMGYIGESLYYELYKGHVNVKYAIDRLAADFRKEFPIYKIEDDLEPVDAVVLTTTEENEEIIQKVKEKLDCPVIMISEILWTLGIETAE